MRYLITLDDPEHETLDLINEFLNIMYSRKRKIKLVDIQVFPEFKKIEINNGVSQPGFEVKNENRT